MHKFEKKFLFFVIVLAISLILIGALIYFSGLGSDEESVILPERKTTEELLEELTPDNPMPMTQEERNELDALLKRLTPAQ